MRLSRLVRRPAAVCAGVLLLTLGPGSVGQEPDPPTVAGVRLGTLPAAARAVLGPPEHEDRAVGLRFWSYSGRGITLIWSETTPGLHGIVLSKPGAGDIQGVHVGSPMSEAARRWGPAAQVRQAGRFRDYVRRGWTLSAQVAHATIVEITMLAVADEGHEHSHSFSEGSHAKDPLWTAVGVGRHGGMRQQ